MKQTVYIWWQLLLPNSWVSKLVSFGHLDSRFLLKAIPTPQWVTLFGNVIHLLTFKQFIFSFLGSSRTLYSSYFFMFTILLKLLYPKLYLLKHLNLWLQRNFPLYPLNSCWILCAPCLERWSTIKPLVFVFGARLPRPTWLLYLFPSEHTLGDWWKFGGNISPPVYSVKSEKSLLNVVNPKRENYWTNLGWLS